MHIQPTPATPQLSETTTMTSGGKSFTIYTSTAEARKVLKHNTQIVLTVTPKGSQKDLFISQTPIAWKVLDFSPRNDLQYNITWHADPAFAVIGRFESNTHVSPGNSGVLKIQGGGAIWGSAQGKRGQVMARNETPIPQTFTLGSVDEDDNFESFVRFPPTPSGGAVSVEPASYLQAYTVTGYKEGQLLSQTDSNSFIFRKYDGSPLPIDLTTLQDGHAFLLSSEPSGRLVLE
ncbi:hypothetical protein K474DRAFT_1663678 [Panus rudis PR-1116 ss-1]|nr:hypothetical protein K474DRAFT_1663678 [Panus rudis PR-1116 ss-1]